MLLDRDDVHRIDDLDMEIVMMMMMIAVVVAVVVVAVVLMTLHQADQRWDHRDVVYVAVYRWPIDYHFHILLEC